MESEKQWRLIDSGPCSASFNMALDEAIARSVRKGISPPTLRLYSWEIPSVSIGAFQEGTDINVEYCAARTIPVLRRPTGGRAILHDKELTYSFSARTDIGPFSKGLLDSYRTIGMAFRLAFKKSGIHADIRKEKERGKILIRSPLCFTSSSYGELLVQDKKVIGSAQKRWKDGLLQQGSIPYICDYESMRTIFGYTQPSSLRDCMIGIKEIIPELKEDEFTHMICLSFEEVFGIRFVHSRPSQKEALLAQKLANGKYLPLRDSAVQKERRRLGFLLQG